MASRHEIISIDFRANAAKANPAMDALRESAKNMRTEVEKTKTAISDGIKTGKSQEELDKLGAKLRTQERELKSFETAMNTLAKGVTTLSRAIDAFNTGTLDQMSAAFQKASYNAAENAKKALLPNSKDYQKNMAELDALQQKNLENLAKYKLRTEQMLQSIGKEGSKISSQDLKQEADGIQELMRLLPHMSHEWLEYDDILKQVNAAIKQQTDDEKRLTGAIVDANDARQRSSQLSRQGVENAARQRKEAEAEVKQRTENIAALKEERAEKAKQVSIDAANAIAKDKEVEKQRKVIAAIQDRIDNEKKDAERKQKNIDKLNQEAEAYDKTAKASREAAETMKTEVKGIDDELEQVNEELAKMGGAAPAAPKNPVLEGVKQGAEEAKQEVSELITAQEKLVQMQKVLKEKMTLAFGSDAADKNPTATDVDIIAALNRSARTGRKTPWQEAGNYQNKTPQELAENFINARNHNENWIGEDGKLEDGGDTYIKDRIKDAKEKLRFELQMLLHESIPMDELKKFADEWGKALSANGEALRRTLTTDDLSYMDNLIEKAITLKELQVQRAEVAKQSGIVTRLKVESELTDEVADKNLEGSKQSAAAKKEETKATEENTAAKEKEVKAGETAAKSAENEKVTVESLIKRNDELKIKIAALNEERKQMLATQEKNAAAVKEEANAYKDLSKEQAQAMLDQKQQLATFKKEGEKWQIGNREEAQRYLFDALGEINPANVGKTTMSIESSPEKISQLLGKFQERYGIEGEGEAMAAVRELMSGGGLVKSGFMNKFFMNVEQDTPKVAAYSKEIKDLTAVINGEVKAVEEDTEKKRTLADVEAELKAAEEESRDISIQTMKMMNGQADATEGLTQKTVRLTDAQKERIATIKAETEAIRQMSQEEAKAALNEVKKVSTVGYKGGKLHMSDPEEVQQFLIGKMRTIGKVKNDNGTLSLAGGQVDALVSAFQQRYDWKDDKTNAKALLKKILQGKGGMFMGGTADLSGDVGSVTIQYVKDIYDARIERAKALVDVSNGVKKATDEVSDATHRSADAAKDATEATNGQTDAIKAQEAEVMRRKAAFDKMNEEYEQADKKLKDMRQRYASLPSSGTDAALAKAQLKDEIDDYNENVVKKARADKNRLKNLWEQSVSELTKMMGISTEETQESTDAQNQENAAIERGNKGRGRKKKAVEDATQAVREEAKAEGDAAKQQEQLSEQDRKRIALEQKKQELEAKRGQKIDEITKKEEAADAAEVRANNNRSEARQMTEELSQAHGKNADAMGKATDELKKLEFEQDGLNKKADEGRKALAEYDQKIDDNAEKRLEAQKKQAQAQRLTIDTMTEAVKVLEAENRTIEPESKKWQENNRLIRQYKEELDRLKQQPVLQLMTERMGSIRSLSADALQETKKFWQTMADGAERGSHQLEVYEGNLHVIAEEERQRQQQIQQPMRQRLNNLGNLSTADLAETKRYWETVRDGVSQTSAAYKKAELAVKALTNEENRRKANVQAQYINEQMRDLNNLSTSGLTEVKRYWQAMADGAKRGSDEAKDAEAALKRINEIESERRRAADKQQVRTLFGDLSKKNGEEIRAAIEAGRRLIDTYDSGGPAAKRLSQAILDAEEHLKQYGIEAERSARREAQALEEAAQRRKEQDQLMRQQLDQGTSLSESALKTQQQYWQRLIDDPKTAKESLAGYRYELERTIALQEQQASVTREERAARLNGNLRDYSTAEIREAIEAAKQLAASYKSGSTEATELTKKIVAAEEHLNKFSIEAARKVKKENDELQEQQATLAKSQTGGFDGASMDQLDEAIKRLKAYRALIENPSTSGKGTFDDVTAEIEKLTAQLDALKGKTDKAKAAFADADEVMKRFSEHMGESKTAAEGVGHAFDEATSARISDIDEDIKQVSEFIKGAEEDVKRDEEMIARLEKEMKTLQTLYNNGVKFIPGIGNEHKKAIERKRDLLEGNGEDIFGWKPGLKQDQEYLAYWKEQLEVLKQERAETLQQAAAEQEVQKARRMTREEMQQGIKVLEEEAMAQDRSTADGQKRWEELRKTIGEMNRELKEATGEWMKLADAQKIAEGAGKKGFSASAQEIQAATKALERRREELIKQIRAERDLGNAVDAQEKELDDLTKKLRSLKFEQDNVNMSQQKMRTLIETPAKAVNLDELRAAIKRADGQLRQMQQSLGQNSDEYKRFAEQVRQAKNVMKEMEGQAKASATAWEKAFSRLKTYVVMYMGFNELWQKVSGTLGDLMQLSDRMGEVGKTTQMTAEQVGRLTDRLRDLDTRTSLVALTELSAKAGQLGLKTEEDILGFTEAANKMLVALPEMGADGATQMMKVALATGEVNRIKKDMDKGLIEGSSATAVAMEKIASTIDQLRANSAAAAPQITDFVKRVGAVGAQSGISIDQVAALGSTVDALGMRVEMSATALSRMIPAIRNNAFEVAKAIGMAPEALRKMFDEAGGGMNAMLAIFQHIKDAGMNPDDIEKMLGMGGMRDIMKDLNQQGARAGIVFAGLSQNVDVLRQHLGIAAEAYEENVAIQQEYDRMSETTAAKWERLKNQFEEMWVGTSANNALGGVIDALRVIVDLISGPLNTAFNSAVVSIVAIKSGLTSIPAAAGSVFDYLKESAQKAAADLEKAANATDAISDAAEGVGEAADVVGDIGDALSDAKEAGEQAGEAVESATGAISGMSAASKVSIFSINGLKTAWKGLDTTMKANIIVAVIALLYTLGKAIYDIVNSVDAEKKALAEANQEADRATEKLGVYFDHLKDTTAELDAARKATEGLTAGTDKATEAEIRMTKATDNHRTAIANINQNYSKYLGFMLTEYDRAEMVAAAHNKIAAAIRREILMKQKQASIEENEKKHKDDLSDDWAKIVSQMTEDDRMTGDQAASARLAFKKMLSKSYTTNANGDLVASDTLKKSLGSLYNDNASLEQLTAVWMARHLQQNYGLSRNAIKDITGIDYYKSNYGTSRGQYIWTTSKELWGNNLRGDYLEEYFDMQRENAKTGRLYQEDIGAAEEDLKESTTTIVGQLKDNINAQISLLRQSDLSAKERNDAYAELARALEGVNENVDDLETAEQQQTKQFVTDVLEKNKKFIDSSRLQRARDKILQGYDAFDTLNTETNNIWGNRLPAESTDWKNMTAEQLVNRRKQMADFVNAIQTDTDVKAVLEEDKALMKAFKGRQATMREVVEWYNQQRLLIQDELHARHLTNTGDWLDPKKERGAKKQFRDEMDAYLHELDAYYTERKTRIEEAGTDEGLTEAEIRNRTLANEMEWQQRRAELQKLYSRKQQEVTQEELNAIYHIISERTGDTESFVKAQIAKTNQFVDAIEKSGDKGAAIVHRWMSQVELDTERSYLKGQQALTKQMKAIQDIIDKERPFNGITKQLRESLSTMDILTGDMRKEYDELMKAGKDMRDFNERQGREELRRTSFLLGEAEQAYSTTIDRVMQQMREKGMGQWADWLSIRPEQQEALMAQLRQTYDGIQDAIKKEASQLKKQAEIMWNNILVPGGDGNTTMKQMLDRTVAQLGIDQGRVSRANSLIGAGASSERVADKLAIQQMRLQLTMQEHYYNLMKKQGRAHVDMLNQQADAAERRGDAEEATRKRLDAQHAKMALNLATAKEETELEKQREEIIARTEESQNRLYTELRSWADLLTSSLQGVMEASHAGDAEYYNERAKLNLTGKGGPGAGTYIVIDDAGTSDAAAHYEYLDERQALERQHEIEVQNAQAEAWKKLWDDINMKMSEQITDWMNAYLQNQSIDANTQAVIANTQAIYDSMGQGDSTDFTDASQLKRDENGFALDSSGQVIAPIQPTEPAQTEQPKSYWPIGDAEQMPMWAATDPANTAATNANTQAVNALTQKLGGQAPAASAPADVPAAPAPASAPAGGEAADGVFLQKPFFQMTEEEKAQAMTAIGELWQAYNTGGVEAMTQMAASLAEIQGVVLPPWQIREDELEAVMERMGMLWQSYANQGIAAMQQMSDAMAEMPNKIPDPTGLTEERIEKAGENLAALGQQEIDMSNLVTQKKVDNKQKEVTTETQTDKKIASTNASTFAKMTQAVNLYGIAYQTMSNDNLDTAQKFQMFALQAAGNAAIAGLNAALSQATGESAASTAAGNAKAYEEAGPYAAPFIIAVMSALLGGMMGLAASKIAKSKSEIAQVTGASVSQGRLATGMLTYAEGNVNELTDPASLTPGRQYNVDGADGKTYRAKYMGKGAKTHITNGPEFHLVGEAGREAIIDAKTTRLLQLNETGIWRDIQTLYNGGSISGLSTRRRRGGMPAFADGNLSDFSDGSEYSEYSENSGMNADVMASMLETNSRLADLLENALVNGIKAVNKWTGSDGIPAMYNKMQKEAQRHGEKYL